MANERWISPFPNTLAFNLFKKHFTELNEVYWSFVPAANTIVSNAKKSLIFNEADPKKFFLIPDADDHRIAQTFGQWKSNFSEFSNYTRLNMLMLLSSCFETYFRTVISISFESKPGVIIMCPDSVDGVFLLKNRAQYGDIKDKNYQFANHIEEVCQGDWAKRFSAFTKYFGVPPQSVLEMSDELDRFRIMRNNIGHYLGRTKSDYSAPLLFTPISATRISHDKLLKYFKLVNDVTREIDLYLKTNYIGSYDIIKCYFEQVSKGFFSANRPGIKAREFRQLLGSEGLPHVGNEYYRNIVSYFDLDNSNDMCRYSIKACLKEINRQLNAKGTPLILNGRAIRFGKFHFNLFVRTHSWRENIEYCKKNSANTEQVEYRYSMKLIEKIIEEIEEKPDQIIPNLLEARASL